MSNPDVQLLTQEMVDQATLRIKEKTVAPRTNAQLKSPISGGLDPYVGPWDHTQASHLLRRTMLGPKKSDIDWALENGPEATIQALLADSPLPDHPINYFFQNDPLVPVGETWVGKPFTQETINYRRQSLFSWTMGNMLEEGISAREKMTLFWHNHFVTADIFDPLVVYQYITLLRTQSLGNFKQLTKDITVNPAMLVYLNGNQNTKFAPNENYARELLELFTVGKGELAGPGDYTTFTEDDVREVARVLTGWRVRYLDTGDMPFPMFNTNQHDTGNKQLSHRFNNTLISNNGDQEYGDLVDIIFEHPEASRFLCRKLYRWFVYYIIDDTIEATVIEPMAQILRDNDYDIKPVLETLLKSEHFYDINSVGCIIKNPIEFLVANAKQFEIKMPANILQRYQIWGGLFRTTELIQMVYYFPPSVAGWKAFYQEPSFNELWINAVTLVIRQLYTDLISTIGFESVGDSRFIIDALVFTAKIDNVVDPNDLIQGIAQIMYPVLLTQDQINAFKEVLIPGLPDFEWTVEYQAYLNDPTNDDIRVPVESKLRALIRSMLARPEYHLQ
jgi:hypothetical protein